MPTPIRSAVVFCGSRPGRDPAWREAAQALGRGMAEAGIRLIYGGGRTGLMGAVADGVLDAGGAVTGIIPRFLQAREVAHVGVQELIVTDSMHSRKQLMFEHADAFVTLPGGLGTLDETVEIITWRQLGLHNKPILVANIGGWAAGLVTLIEGFVADAFATEATHALFEVVPDVPSLLQRLTVLPASHPTDAARL